MNRGLRIAGNVAAATVIAGALAVAALGAWVTWFLDTGVYSEALIRRVEEMTGRTLTLGGELTIDLWPRIVLATGPVSLAPGTDFGDEPMILADRVAVAVQPWALTHGEVLVQRIRLDAPRITLGIDAGGRSAWSDIVERLQVAIGRPGDIGDGEALGMGLAALAAQGVTVRDGALHWTDSRDGFAFALTEVAMDVDRLRSGEPGRFEMTGRLASSRLVSALHVSASARVTVDPDTFDTDIDDVTIGIGSEAFDAVLSATRSRVRLVDGRVRLDGEALSLAATRGDLSVEANAPDAHYETATDTLTVPTLDVAAPGLALRGTVAIADLSGTPSMTLSARSQTLDAAALLQGLGFTDRLAGRGSLSVDVRASGLDADALGRSLGGDIELRLVDGRFRGVDVGRLLAAARGADASGAPADGEPLTRFERAGAVMRFDNGVGRSRALALLAEGFRADGECELDLPGNRIDLRLSVFAGRTGAPGENGASYEPVPVPLRVSGTLDAPRIDIDFQALMRANAG